MFPDVAAGARSPLLLLHFSLKIAPVIIYSGGRAAPVLCCSRPITGRHSRGLSLPCSQLHVRYSLFLVDIALGLTP